jgi:hypothetical protein
VKMFCSVLIMIQSVLLDTGLHCEPSFRGNEYQLNSENWALQILDWHHWPTRNVRFCCVFRLSVNIRLISEFMHVTGDCCDVCALGKKFLLILSMMVTLPEVSNWFVLNGARQYEEFPSLKIHLLVTAI